MIHRINFSITAYFTEIDIHLLILPSIFMINSKISSRFQNSRKYMINEKVLPANKYIE